MANLGIVEGDSVKLTSNFRGIGGFGMRVAWLFSLSLIPSVVFALGIVKMVEYLEGIAAWLSTGGGGRYGGKFVYKWQISGTDVAILLPAIMLMGSQI